MDSTQLQNLLMEKAHTMPNKARRVAEYLLANMREASFRSIGDIADELKVSKAQLVRVAQMLGFSGYAELKACLQKPYLNRSIPPRSSRAPSVQTTLSPTASSRRSTRTSTTRWRSLCPPT